MTINRKIVAVIMALVLIIASSIPAKTMAKESVSNPDAQICGTLGMLLGDDKGLTDTYLSNKPTRIQAAVLYLRLKGLEKEAMSFNGTTNFSDANKAKWAEKVMAYLKAHPELGMVGTGDNKFSPDTYIDAQAYYKTLLEALGYKAGTDFTWEGTFEFAKSKGLSKVANETSFTLNSLATATVEALRAPSKGSMETLAGSLVKAGLFTNVQIEALTTADIKLASIAFDITVKTSTSFNVKFDNAVTDTSKIYYTVIKDNNPVDSLISNWSQDGKELNISKKTKLEVGSYTVKIMYQNTVLGAKTVEVQQEKVASLVFSPKVLIKITDIKGEASYKAYNQYGEDISTSQLIKNILWSSSAESVSVDVNNTKLIVTKTGTAGNQLKDMKEVIIAGYDSSSNLTVSDKLSVSDGYGLIKDVKFLGIKNKDGKTEITVDTKDRFYIDYEAYDVDGKKVDTYSVLSNVATFGLYSNNPNISANVVRDPDNTTKALIEIDTHTASGTAEISGIAMSTGKKAALNVEVKKGAVLTTFVIESPAAGLPINERVEIPYKALDQNGNPIKDFDQINGKLLFVVVDSVNSSIVGERAQNGNYVLTGRFDLVKKYNIKVIIIDANKTSDFVIETKPAPIPTTISSINRDIICDSIVEGGEIRADFVNNPAFSIQDQNNNAYNLKDNNLIGTQYYYINVTSLDPKKVSISNGSSIAYKDTEIVLIGGSTKGSTTVTFELCRDTDLNPSNGKEVLDVKDMVISNIDRKEIAEYFFKTIPTLYANPDLTQNDTYNTVSPQKKQYAGDIKVFGKMADGKRVALNPTIGAGNNVLTVTVTDSKKFNIDLTYKKILAKPVGNEDTITDKLTATIMGGNGAIYTISTDLKASKAVPVAQSIDAVLKPGSQIQKSGDSYSCTINTFNSNIVGKELRIYNSFGNDAVKADISYLILDQYGNKGLNPSYFAVTKTQGSGSLTVDAETGYVSGSPRSGDQYQITAVTNNGLTKTITINIQ